jgi:TRAP-type mannitol/chloroaromatic compound transport system permease small subunit
LNAALRALQALESINRALFALAAGATFVMALLGCGIVILRYGFSFGSIAAQELVIYLHAFVLLTACATTLAANGHVRVDIFYGRWGPARRGLVDLLGTLLLLLPVMGFLLGVSWDYVGDAWARRESSADAGGLAWVYLLKSLILLFALQMLLQGLLQAQRAWLQWHGGPR